MSSSLLPLIAADSVVFLQLLSISLLPTLALFPRAPSVAVGMTMPIAGGGLALLQGISEIAHMDSHLLRTFFSVFLVALSGYLMFRNRNLRLNSVPVFLGYALLSGFSSIIWRLANAPNPTHADALYLIAAGQAISERQGSFVATRGLLTQFLVADGYPSGSVGAIAGFQALLLFGLALKWASTAISSTNLQYQSRHRFWSLLVGVGILVLTPIFWRFLFYPSEITTLALTLVCLRLMVFGSSDVAGSTNKRNSAALILIVFLASASRIEGGIACLLVIARELVMMKQRSWRLVTKISTATTLGLLVQIALMDTRFPSLDFARVNLLLLAIPIFGCNFLIVAAIHRVQKSRLSLLPMWWSLPLFILGIFASHLIGMAYHRWRPFSSTAAEKHFYNFLLGDWKLVENLFGLGSPWGITFLVAFITLVWCLIKTKNGCSIGAFPILAGIVFFIFLKNLTSGTTASLGFEDSVTRLLVIFTPEIIFYCSIFWGIIRQRFWSTRFRR